jgi:hypothetical protein
VDEEEEKVAGGKKELEMGGCLENNSFVVKSHNLCFVIFFSPAPVSVYNFLFAQINKSPTKGYL